MYNNAVVLVVIVVVYFYFGRPRGQPLQPCSCSRCRVFLFWDDNGDNLYNHAVVPVVIVVVYFYFGQQRGQLHCCLNILHCDSERIKLYCDNSFRVEVGLGKRDFLFDNIFRFHRVLHNGSSCQFCGKPIAVTSTKEYESRRFLNLVLKVSPRPIESNQYAIQHVMAYSLLPSMPEVFIQAPLIVALI